MAKQAGSKRTRSESDAELGGLGVFALGAGEDVLVESLNGTLESGELNHGVRHLAHPQRGQTLEEAVHALSGADAGNSLAEGGGEVGLGRGGLDADLHGLHWAESDIGDELGGSRGGQVHESAVPVRKEMNTNLKKACTHHDLLMGNLVTNSVGVNVFENLIEAELAKALHGVADEGGQPTHGQTGSAALSENGLHARDDTAVLLRVGLIVNETKRFIIVKPLRAS